MHTAYTINRGVRTVSRYGNSHGRFGASFSYEQGHITVRGVGISLLGSRYSSLGVRAHLSLSHIYVPPSWPGIFISRSPFFSFHSLTFHFSVTLQVGYFYMMAVVPIFQAQSNLSIPVGAERMLSGNYFDSTSYLTLSITPPPCVLSVLG